VQLTDSAGKISALTVIPGYDDTKIRKPGLAVDRFDGRLYQLQWQAAIKADPHWVLITSFNEWHEGSEIEPSLEFKDKYLQITAEYTKRFKSTTRTAHGGTAAQQLGQQEKIRLNEKLRALRIAVCPGAESRAFWWLTDLGVKPDLLTYEQIVSGNLTAQKCQLLLYCSGELYKTTVNKTGDIDSALLDYLKSGGFIAFFPSLPWPFYYDEDGRPANRSEKFGLTLRGAWENPPKGAAIRFVQPQPRLAHLPQQFDFPTAGDLRWRPFFSRDKARHTSLLRLQDGNENYLGDAVAYAELPTGGRILYVWFSLLNGPYAEVLLYDLFDFVSERMPSVK
jgi:hypothetical protein